MVKRERLILAPNECYSIYKQICAQSQCLTRNEVNIDV
jgi:hypothetical protein